MKIFFDILPPSWMLGEEDDFIQPLCPRLVQEPQNEGSIAQSEFVSEPPGFELTFVLFGPGLVSTS